MVSLIGSGTRKLKRHLSEDVNTTSSYLSFLPKRPKVWAVRHFPKAFAKFSRQVDLGYIWGEDHNPALVPEESTDSSDQENPDEFELHVDLLKGGLEDVGLVQQLETKENHSTNVVTSFTICPEIVPKTYFSQWNVSAFRDFPKAFQQWDIQSNHVAEKCILTHGNVDGSCDSDNEDDPSESELENDFPVAAKKALVPQRKKVNVCDSDVKIKPLDTEGLSHLELEAIKVEPLDNDICECVLHTNLWDMPCDIKAEKAEPVVAPYQEECVSTDHIGLTRSKGELTLQNVSKEKAHYYQLDRPNSFKMQPDASPKPKRKFRQRNVSAVRTFPLGCGRNTACFNSGEGFVEPLPANETIGLDQKMSIKDIIKAEEDQPDDAKLKGISSKHSREELKSKSNVVTEARKIVHANSAGTEPCGKNFLHYSARKSHKHVKNNGGDVRSLKKQTKEIAVIAIGMDRKFPGVSSNNVDSDQSEHRIIVQALMAAPNCPWRESKSRPTLKQAGVKVGNGQK